MNHSFDIEHAREYGLNEAIILANFQFWIAKNRANCKHQHEGRTWTYNSVRALSELFPYLTAKQIRTALENLVCFGVLVRGNYNQTAYDRTAWYAFKDEDAFLPSPPKPLPKGANESADRGDSLTDINQMKDPPNPLAGVGSQESPKKTRAVRTTLKTFADRCAETGEKAISTYEPLLDYIDRTGLPMEYVQLCWLEFKRQHMPGGESESRLQADWRRHFMNYVRKGYYRLWFFKSDGTCELSTQGLQAQRYHEREVK